MARIRRASAICDGGGSGLPGRAGTRRDGGGEQTGGLQGGDSVLDPVCTVCAVGGVPGDDDGHRTGGGGGAGEYSGHA